MHIFQELLEGGETPGVGCRYRICLFSSLRRGKNNLYGYTMAKIQKRMKHLEITLQQDLYIPANLTVSERPGTEYKQNLSCRFHALISFIFLYETC